MPIIRLTDEMRDAITSALGNELGRRIKSGHAVAVFTYQRAETGEHDYLVEFRRSENAKTVASYRGRSDGAKAAEEVTLRPEHTDWTEAVAEGIYMGDEICTLRHLPSVGEDGHDFRVEFTPPGSSAVYLGLEAKALPGQSVVMKRGDLYPAPGHRFNRLSAK